MAERTLEELEREIASARDDLLATVGRMRAAVHRNLSILGRIERHPIAIGAAAALLYGALLTARAAHGLHAMRRPIVERMGAMLCKR